MAESSTILYFEDDKMQGEMLADYFLSMGIEVDLRPAWPEGGTQELQQYFKTPPVMVLIDIRLPKVNGYEVCRQLREELIPESVPIMFVSGLVEADDMLKAYEAGADDYLTKPIRLHELAVKFQQLTERKQQVAQTSEQVSMAMKMAFDAMKASSELGRIIRFHEGLQLVSSESDIAKMCFEVLTEFEVTSSLVFFGKGKPSIFSAEKKNSPLALESMLAAREKGRIYSWKRFTFFNYQHFSLLVHDMPIEDEERYGILKDQLCLLLNGLDARIEAIWVAKENQHKSIQMGVIAQTMGAMLMEMDEQGISMAKEFESLMLDLEQNVSICLAEFNLMENEERSLMAEIMQAVNKSTEIFEHSLKKEKEYQSVVTSLLKELSNSMISDELSAVLAKQEAN